MDAIGRVPADACLLMLSTCKIGWVHCRHPEDTANSGAKDGLLRLEFRKCEFCFLLKSRWV